MTSPRSSSRVNIASSSGVAAEKRAPLEPLPGDEIKPLSGNPYYDVILPNSAVGPGRYNMDLAMGRTIGVAKQQRGLYYLLNALADGGIDEDAIVMSYYKFRISGIKNLVTS